MLSWQLSDPIYQLLDVVSAFCCFVFFLCYSSVYHTSAHTRRLESRAGRARKPPGVECKKSCAKDFLFFFASLRRGPWKNHCRSELAGEREVTLVPRLHRVITAGAAALCLFSTGCDTDGFDRRDAQSGGPRRASGGLEGKVGGELRVSDRREGETQT